MTNKADSSEFGFELDDAAWLRQAQAALQPQSWDNLGDYKILEEVSRGGQGIVLRATNQQSEVVAIKRLLGGSLTGNRCWSCRGSMDARQIVGHDHWME